MAPTAAHYECHNRHSLTASSFFAFAFLPSPLAGLDFFAAFQTTLFEQACLLKFHPSCLSSLSS